MNAELALFLIEEGLPVDKAKAIAAEATSNADIALGILDALPGAYTVTEAKEIAARAPLVIDMASGVAVPSKPEARLPIRESSGEVLLEHDTREARYGQYVPVVGPDGLTDIQRDALAAKIGLCPNCQQPTNRHLPGCGRQSGETPKAVTKDPLPPAV